MVGVWRMLDVGWRIGPGVMDSFGNDCLTGESPKGERGGGW